MVRTKLEMRDMVLNLMKRYSNHYRLEIHSLKRLILVAKANNDVKTCVRFFQCLSLRELGQKIHT